MDCRQLTKLRPPPPGDIVVLGVLSVAAPLLAALVHSECVFRRGIRLYQAEVLDLSADPFLWAFFAGPACFTFCVLLAFNRHPVLRWGAWICAVILWTLSPGESKPATYGRFKTSHPEARTSYHFFILAQGQTEIFGGWCFLCLVHRTVGLNWLLRLGG